MGFFFKRSKTKTEEPPQSGKKAGSFSIKNKGEFIAAISSAIAQDLGTDVSRLRIISVEKL